MDRIPDDDNSPANGSVEGSAMAGALKSCAQCGIDVSRRRRIKDRQGRYMCGPCHELFFGQPDGGAGAASMGGSMGGTALDPLLADTRPGDDGEELDSDDLASDELLAGGVDPSASGTGGFGSEPRFGTRAGTHPGSFEDRGSRGLVGNEEDRGEEFFRSGYDGAEDSSIIDPDESADGLPVIGAGDRGRTRSSDPGGNTRGQLKYENLPVAQRIPCMEACYRRFAIMVGVQAMMHIALLGAAFAGRGWIPIVVVGMVAISTVVAIAFFNAICRRVDWEGSHQVLLPIAYFVPIFGVLALHLAEKRIRRRLVNRGGNPSILAMFNEDTPEAA